MADSPASSPARFEDLYLDAHDHRALADPRGNEFCCVAPGRHAFPQPQP
ncbi:MAG: hypothetical protein JWR70_564 [Modestobacter sp.]|nr:hypothetical protein [Modestobacter sp.]